MQQQEVAPAAAHLSAIRELLVFGGLDLDRIESLGSEKQNFCNSVYRLNEGYVAKVYSASAKARCPRDERGYWDEKAGLAGIGPRIIAKTENALLLEYIHGESPAENFLQTPQAEAAARRLAKLHSLSIRESRHQKTRPLWRSIETALSRTKDTVSLAAIDLSVHELQSRATSLKSLVIDCLGQPTTWCHGDFKLSNLLIASNDDLVFLDFEMSGPNYAEYDLGKLCRQSFDDSNAFIDVYNYYMKHGAPLQQSTTTSAEIQRLAISLLAAVSWFEAACFFLMMASSSSSSSVRESGEEPDTHHAWLDLTRDRFSSFLAAESNISAADLTTLRRHHLKAKS